MTTIRKATRKTAGRALSDQQVHEAFDAVLRGRSRFTRLDTIRLIRNFFGDDNTEIVAKTLSLVCPISKSRIIDPVRGTSCKHVECFDLRKCLEYHKTMAFWEYPFTFCRQQVGLQELQID
ncbi:MIZ zinc finger protein, partial [Aphelenchoides avenae]